MEQIRDRATLVEHVKRSWERLPGPEYRDVLRWVHAILRPANYLEIGVNDGRSLVEADPSTPAIGIDPAPEITHEVSAATTIFEMPSDEFFERHDPRAALGGPVELAFIDGLHLFE